MNRMENPPAFPVSSIDGFTQYGMDLRDYFAGQAMPAIITDMCGPSESESQDCRHPRVVIAERAYAIADAMLRARLSTEGNG